MFLVFPFQTETDEENKARDIIEALDYDSSPAGSVEPSTRFGHEKMTETKVVPIIEDDKSQIISQLSVV